MGRLAEISDSQLFSALPENVRVEAHVELASALTGADLVLLIYRAGPPDIRQRLDDIARKHSLLAQETQGICGFLAALLNIRQLRLLANEIHRHCADAKVVVVTNPTGILTAAAQELGLDAVGLCELPFGMTRSIARWLDQRDACLDPGSVRYLGLNHFGWMVSARTTTSTANCLLSFGAAIGAAGAHVPPSIPATVASAALILDRDGLPNPYLGFLVENPVGHVRAEQAARADVAARRAIADGLPAEYLQAMRQRGGFLIGAAMANLVGSLLIGAGTAVVCTRNPDLARRFGANAAFEQSVALGPGDCSAANRTPQSDRKLAGGLRMLQAQPALSPPAEALVALMANYESQTVEAALSGQFDDCVRAMVLNPFIAPGGAMRSALISFLRCYGRTMLEPSDDHGARRR